MRFITNQVFFLTLICLLSVNEGLSQGKKKRKVIDKAIVAAESYIGTPYHYGGTSRKGIDCSGLIQNCYSQIGIKLPRTAKEQSKVGSSKSWGSIRPGDIVYFKFKQKGEKWYHTGMITEVDGKKIKFIHASTSRGVVESNLNDDYYRKNVKKFKRVI